MAGNINLFVALLDKRVDDNLLLNEFQKYGTVLSACVAKDETGASRSYGFVCFRNFNDGMRAMREMNCKKLLSRTIRVEIANTQAEGKGHNVHKSMWQSEWGINLDHNSDIESISDTASQFSDEQEVHQYISDDVNSRMRKLFENQLYTDVIFYPKNDCSSSISAHKAFLAVGSPLFAKMLFGSKDTSGAKMEVHISNMSFNAFSNIIKYLYTDEVFFESNALVQEIIAGAKHFGIHSLVERCKMYFENLELRDDNVCSTLQMSISDKIGVLKTRCIDYIQRNTFNVLNSDDFLKCSPSTIRTILKLQSLNVQSEMKLFEVAMKWLNSQPPVSRNQHREPLLKCIRFLNFTVTEFGDVLKKFPNIFSSEDGLKIMLYLYNPPKTPDFNTLPDWCNKNTMSRCFVMEEPRSLRAGNVQRQETQTGKVIFPLKPSSDGKNISELASLLQMKCINGAHQINAIKLSFHGPVNDRSAIRILTVCVTVSPSRFRVVENIEIANSQHIRIPFSRTIKVRRGDMVDIEVDAKDIQLYKFLQFDDTRNVPANPHFTCSVASRPRIGKLFFISEVEYGPQTNNRLRR